MSNEFSTPKLTPADNVKIPGVDGNNDSGYLLSEEVKDYMVGGVYGETEEYSTLETYSVGDRVTNEGVLYRCTTAVSTPEVFDSDKWEAITLDSLDEGLLAKLDESKVYNGLDQTSEGYALDARQGKVLNDAITSLSYSFLSTSDVEIGSHWKIPRGVFGFKKGNMVYLSFDAESIQASSSDTIITLPVEWRPLTEKRCILAMYTRAGATDVYNDYVVVGTNGNIWQTITGTFQVGSSLTAIFIYDVSV